MSQQPVLMTGSSVLRPLPLATASPTLQETQMGHPSGGGTTGGQTHIICSDFAWLVPTGKGPTTKCSLMSTSLRPSS